MKKGKIDKSRIEIDSQRDNRIEEKMENNEKEKDILDGCKDHRLSLRTLEKGLKRKDQI